MLQPVKPTYKAPRLSAQTQNWKDRIFPAPTKGLDTSTPLTEMDPKTAVILQNFFARRTGAELRPGWRRWTTNLGGVGTESAVRSVMSYQPPRGAGSVQLPRLFAACENGNIYDVSSRTNEAAVPAVSVNVPAQLQPGEFSWTNFSTVAANYLCIVSAGAGYYTWDDAGGWVNRTANVTSTGGDNINFDFVLVWKNRLWFLVENSSRAWYLPVGAITGAANSFEFGSLLTYGGEIRAMASWTLDSGAGIDDKLVLVGSQGDVLIYAGTDPTSAATFGIIGKWYIGPVPAGRRFMGKYGGDLAIICEKGIEYMSRLVEAHGLVDPESATDDVIPRRYNEVIGADVIATRGQIGWAYVHVPGEQAVIVGTPNYVVGDSHQYCFSTIPSAWSDFTKMPMACLEVYDGYLYFGTTIGKIGQAFIGDSDDELSDGTPGTSLTGDLQSAYISPDDDSVSLKRPQLVMPMFRATDPPGYLAQINTEWSVVSNPGSAPFSPSLASVWDVALWDVGVWGPAYNTYQGWVGVSGLGCYMSLRMTVTGAPRTTFTSWKLLYEPGGVM